MSELEFSLFQLGVCGGGVELGADSLRFQIGPLTQHGVLADSDTWGPFLAQLPH